MPEKAQKHSRYTIHSQGKSSGHNHSRGEPDDDNWKRQVQRGQFGDDEDDFQLPRSRSYEDTETDR